MIQNTVLISNLMFHHLQFYIMFLFSDQLVSKWCLVDQRGWKEFGIQTESLTKSPKPKTTWKKILNVIVLFFSSSIPSLLDSSVFPSMTSLLLLTPLNLLTSHLSPLCFICFLYSSSAAFSSIGWHHTPCTIVLSFLFFLKQQNICRRITNTEKAVNITHSLRDWKLDIRGLPLVQWPSRMCCNTHGNMWCVQRQWHRKIRKQCFRVKLHLDYPQLAKFPKDFIDHCQECAQDYFNYFLPSSLVTVFAFFFNTTTL